MSSDVCEPSTSTDQPDVQYSRKTPKQICLCIVEKLNMIFLVFFICYLSWSIPANYGLFTSGPSHFNISTEYDSKRYKVSILVPNTQLLQNIFIIYARFSNYNCMHMMKIRTGEISVSGQENMVLSKSVRWQYPGTNTKQ